MMWPFSVFARRRIETQHRIIFLLAKEGEQSSFTIGDKLKLGPGSLYPSLSAVGTRWTCL